MLAHVTDIVTLFALGHQVLHAAGLPQAAASLLPLLGLLVPVLLVVGRLLVVLPLPALPVVLLGGRDLAPEAAVVVGLGGALVLLPLLAPALLAGSAALALALLRALLLLSVLLPLPLVFLLVLAVGSVLVTPDDELEEVVDVLVAAEAWGFDDVHYVLLPAGL